MYQEKLLHAIGGRKRKMEWGTKRKWQRESVWERKRWNGRVKRERERERERARKREGGREREYRPSVVFKCEAENHLCGSGEWGGDSSVRWEGLLSLFRSLFVLQCPWFYLQASKWEDRRTESFYKTTIPGRGDIWTPHNGWIEDKVLSYPTAVSEWYRYSSCFRLFFLPFTKYQHAANAIEMFRKQICFSLDARKMVVFLWKRSALEDQHEYLYLISHSVIIIAYIMKDMPWDWMAGSFHKFSRRFYSFIVWHSISVYMLCG